MVPRSYSDCRVTTNDYKLQGPDKPLEQQQLQSCFMNGIHVQCNQTNSRIVQACRKNAIKRRGITKNMSSGTRRY
jgi:hypothetical protein